MHSPSDGSKQEGAPEGIEIPDLELDINDPEGDLAEELKDHRVWLKTRGKEGSKASFRDRDLRGLNLTGLDLISVDLRGADLEGRGVAGAVAHTPAHVGVDRHVAIADQDLAGGGRG